MYIEASLCVTVILYDTIVLEVVDYLALHNAVFCLLLLVVCSLLFFFSSRRRHTRFDCDWSSDVCSSDLFVSAISVLWGVETTFLRLLIELSRSSTACYQRAPSNMSNAAYQYRLKWILARDRKSVV